MLVIFFHANGLLLNKCGGAQQKAERKNTLKFHNLKILTEQNVPQFKIFTNPKIIFLHVLLSPTFTSLIAYCNF